MMEEMYGEFLKVIFVLLGLVAALGILYKVMGRYRGNWRPGGSPYGLKRIETIPLGYKKFLSVVEVKDQILLIGVGQERISLLAKWKKEKEGSS